MVTSDGLLGDNYILLNIGGDTEMLAPNDRIRNVQGAINLADLINKFVVGTDSGSVSSWKVSTHPDDAWSEWSSFDGPPA